MKTFNKKLLALAVLPLAQSAVAGTTAVSVGFTTLPEITITQIRAMNFGQILAQPNGATCEMAVSGTATLAPTLDKSLAAAAAGTAGALTGCSTAATTDNTRIGIYEVSALFDQAVNIVVTGESNADILFQPQGYVPNVTGAGTASGDNTFSNITLPTGTNVATSSVTVATPAAANATSNVTPGITRIILGGKITNNRELLADEIVTAALTIDVNY